MASKLSMKNNLNNELTITHSDDTLPITVDSVDLSKVITINSLSDLKDKIGYGKHKPPTIWISGYHTKGDNAFGSHIFEWDKNCTENHNGGTIIDLDADFPTDWTDGTQVNNWYNYGSVTSGRYKLKYNGAVNAKWFGAVGDGITDDTLAIQSAINSIKDTGTILIDGSVLVKDKIIIDSKNISLYGINDSIIEFSSNGGIEYTNFISYINIENIIFKHLEIDTVDSNIPLLNIHKAFKIKISSCSFLGNDKREFGVTIGSDSTVWGSEFSNNHFGYCKNNVVIGGTGDATHNIFINNTVDHAKNCGAIFCNPNGGLIKSNSFEHIEGTVGLAILSGYGNTPNKAKNITIENNYILYVATDNNDDENSAGIIAGFDVPNTSYTSPDNCMNINIINNNCVPTYTRYAIKTKMFVDCVITDNAISSSQNTDTNDIYIKGEYGRYIINRNRNTNNGNYDKVYIDGKSILKSEYSTNHDYNYKIPYKDVSYNIGNNSYEINRNFIVPIEVTNTSANSSYTVFDRSKYSDVGVILLTFFGSQTNQSNEESVILTADFENQAITTIASNGANFFSFSIDSNGLYVTANQDFHGSAMAICTGNLW